MKFPFFPIHNPHSPQSALQCGEQEPTTPPRSIPPAINQDAATTNDETIFIKPKQRSPLPLATPKLRPSEFAPSLPSTPPPSHARSGSAATITQSSINPSFQNLPPTLESLPPPLQAQKITNTPYNLPPNPLLSASIPPPGLPPLPLYPPPPAPLHIPPPPTLLLANTPSTTWIHPTDNLAHLWICCACHSINPFTRLDCLDEHALGCAHNCAFAAYIGSEVAGEDAEQDTAAESVWGETGGWGYSGQRDRVRVTYCQECLFKRAVPGEVSRRSLVGFETPPVRGSWVEHGAVGECGEDAVAGSGEVEEGGGSGGVGEEVVDRSEVGNGAGITAASAALAAAINGDGEEGRDASLGLGFGTLRRGWRERAQR